MKRESKERTEILLKKHPETRENVLLSLQLRIIYKELQKKPLLLQNSTPA
jgi:hypothetical protein